MQDKVSSLHERLNAAAKANPTRRFHSLRDKVYRMDVLQRAWQEVRKNQGAPGVDGVTIAMVEEQGVDAFLHGLQEELRLGTYVPPPVRRVEIAKPSGGVRRLGIPTVRDRVAQAAVKLILEPIFEADFLPMSYGYRPGRSAKDATLEVAKWLNFGLEFVVDADIESCFDSIPHGRLLEAVARRVSDGYVLRLVKLWLKAGVMVGGGVVASEEGTPQGGVLSPLLANIYLHQLDVEWERRDLARRTGADAKLLRYADDLVVLSSKPVEGVFSELRSILAGLGLRLSERKTRLVRAEQGFDFLGFRFVRHDSRGRGKRVTRFFPSPKSVKRVKSAIRERAGRRRLHLMPEQVAQDLNNLVRGWVQYYRHSFAYPAFVRVQSYRNVRFQKFLRRRKGKSRLGRYRDCPNEVLYGEFGLVWITAPGMVQPYGRELLRDVGGRRAV